MRLFAAQYYDRCAVVKYRYWLYTGAGNIFDFSADCTERICGELRRGCLSCFDHSESGAAEGYGSRQGQDECGERMMLEKMK